MSNTEYLRSVLDQLYEEIKHGDDEHQAWLKAKIDMYYEDLIKSLKTSEDQASPSKPSPHPPTLRLPDSRFL